MFPKQFKTQQYYDILKQVCPELEKAQPGALKSERLPDLTTVISVDAPLPGTLLLDNIVAAGGKEQNLAQLRYNQRFLSCYDPINIQFTSVGQQSPVPTWALPRGPTLGRGRRQEGGSSLLSSLWSPALHLPQKIGKISSWCFFVWFCLVVVTSAFRVLLLPVQSRFT